METHTVGTRDWATIPNAITLLRLLLVVPIVLYLVTDTEPTLTAVLLIIFGLSDWIDGFIARTFGQVSKFGIQFDPLADRLGIVAITIALVVNGAVPLWIGLAIFLTDLVLLCSYLWLRLDVPPASTWWGKVRTALMMLGLDCVAFGRIPQLQVLSMVGIVILSAATVMHLQVGYGYLRLMRATAAQGKTTNGKPAHG